MKDKKETKRKLINAVAFIFRNKGYAGLGLNKVARLAGVNKKLIDLKKERQGALAAEI
jgi:AcrR family transcriptional regulator